MKRILLTGGAGYIGSVVAGNLLSLGYQVRVLDRLMFGGESLLSIFDNPNFELINADVREKKTIRKNLQGIDAVVHLAALVGDPACKIDKNATNEINFLATEHIAKEAKLAGIKKFIFSSTCSNYGLTSVSELATEESRLNPLSLYAETKIEAEKAIIKLVDDDFSPVVFRFATIFGLSPRMRFNLLLNEFARETALDGVLSIRNKKAFRPYLHVLDASAAITIMLEKKHLNKNGIYNVVGENIQKGYLADIAKKINKKVNLTIEEGKLDDRRDYAVSAAKFETETGWKPAISVEEGFNSIYKAVIDRVFKDPYESRYNDWVDELILKEKFN